MKKIYILFLLFVISSCQNNSTPPIEDESKNTSVKLVEESTKEYNAKNYKLSIELADKAIKIYPQSTGAFGNRGFSKYEIGDYQGAIADLSRCIEMQKSDNAKNHSREDYMLNVLIEKRGESKLMVNDLRGALNDFNEVIRIEPNSNVYIKMGSVKHELGDMNGACNSWSKAGELGNDEAYNLIQSFCN